MTLNSPKRDADCEVPKLSTAEPDAAIEYSRCRDSLNSDEPGSTGLVDQGDLKPSQNKQQVRRIVIRSKLAEKNITHKAGQVSQSHSNVPLPHKLQPVDNSTGKNRPDRLRWRNIAVAVGVIIVAGGGLLIGTNTLSVEPSIAGLYKLAGINLNSPSLRFEAVTTRRDQLTEGNVLIVEGTIKNISNDPVRVPAVRLQTRGATKANLSGWTYEPAQIKLKAGNSMKFSTRLYGPPDNVQDILLEFTTRSKPPKVAG